VNPTPPSPSFGHSVIQDWGKRISPHKDRRETFVGNAGILQFFGNNDLAATVYVSRRLDSSKRVSGKPGAIQYDYQGYSNSPFQGHGRVHGAFNVERRK
jgi:hypothetical protein